MDYKYIAGFLDGEGYIHLRKDSGSLIVGLINTKELPIKEIKNFLKVGSIQITKPPLKHRNWSDCYRYIIATNQGKELLKNLLPYLIIKKQTANIALEFNKKIHNILQYTDKMKQTRENKLNEGEISWSYLAGFIDGEGSITINERMRKSRPSPLFTLSLTIVNTHLGVLKSIQKLTGGFIHVRKPYGKSNWNQGYSLIISTNDANNVLKSILPYSTLKKPQIQIALKFQQLKQKRTSKQPLTNKEIKLYQTYMEAIKKHHL